MMKMKPSHSQKSSAQAMVEFALVLPILLLVIYGLLEVGRLLFIYSSVVSAARQAVRYGATTGVNASGTLRYRDCDGMRAAAKRVGFIDEIVDTDIVIQHDEGEGIGTVTYCPPGQAIDSTNFQPSTGNLNRIRVTVSVDYAPILPLVPLNIPNIESVSARTLLVSVPIVVDAPPVGWDPGEPPIPPLPVAFTKSSPADGATDQTTSVTLAWNASSGATSYEACYDITNDNACSSWVNNGSSTSMQISNLTNGTTYYWHVRALNATGTAYSNASSTAFWSFTTAALPPPPVPPLDFTKSSPGNGATDQATSVTLAWSASSGATSYEGCYDTTNDNACSSWVNNGSSTSMPISNLATSTTYYWHVRALNATGTTYSNASSTAFWSFTTSALPPPPPACSVSHSTLKIIVSDPKKVSMTLQNDLASTLTIHIKSIKVTFNDSGGQKIKVFFIIPDQIWSGNTGSSLTITIANPTLATYTFAPNVSKILTAEFSKDYVFSVGNNFEITFVEPECPVVTVTQ